jgi:hypothetical protein
MSQFITPALLQVFDSSGNPLSGGKCYIYQTGTTSELDLFSDEGLTTPLANPILADTAGVFAAAYIAETECKVVITTAADVTIYTRDPVFPSGEAGTFAAANVTYDGTPAGHAATDVQEALEEVQDNIDTVQTNVNAKISTSDIATSTQYRAATADKVLDTDAVWDAMAEVTLTDAATIAWDMSLGFDFTVTLTANRTLGNPTNTTVGKRGRIRVVQDGTGSRTLTKSSNHKTAGGFALSIAAAAGAETYVYYDCVSSTKILLSNSALAWS